MANDEWGMGNGEWGTGSGKLEDFSATHLGPYGGYAQQYLFHYVRTRLSRSWVRAGGERTRRPVRVRQEHRFWREEVPDARSKCPVKSASDSLERDLVDTVGSALGSVWLILPAWLVVVSIGGFIPAWVHERSWDMDPTMLLMWIVELGMSALTIVGLLPILLHWWFLRSMLEGQDVVWNLWRSFVTQVLTGSVVLGM